MQDMSVVPLDDFCAHGASNLPLWDHMGGCSKMGRLPKDSLEEGTWTKTHWLGHPIKMYEYIPCVVFDETFSCLHFTYTYTRLTFCFLK